MSEKYEELLKKSLSKAKALYESFDKKNPIRVVSHIDADGLSSAGIVCNMLHREGIPFHASLIRDLSPEFIATIESNEPDRSSFIFSDMGSAQLDQLERLEKKIIILDHHKPLRETKDDSTAQVNAHLCGLDGSFEVSSSGLAFSFCMMLNPQNIWLAPLALAGTCGDRQNFGTGLNKKILNLALENKILQTELVMKLRGVNIQEAVVNSVDPFFTELSGDPEKTRDLLGKIGVPSQNRLESLGEGEKERLSSMLVTRLIKQGASPAGIESIWEDRYYTKFRESGDVANLSFMLDACGYLDKPGLALSYLLGDKKSMEEVEQTTGEYRKRVLNELMRISRVGVNMENGFDWIGVEDKKVTSEVINLSSVFLFNKKPLLALSRKKEKINVSARVSPALAKKGVDLADALGEAARSVGGYGGGHPVAAGAKIPLDKQEQFLNAFGLLIKKQLEVK
jgi:RecJ-like exonuclease